MVVHCCECGNLVSARADSCPFCGFDMHQPVSGPEKKRLALKKLRTSQAWVAGALLISVVTMLFSVGMIRSARALQEPLQAEALRKTTTLKMDDPRLKEIATREADYQTAVTLAILLGIGDIVLLTWAIRKYHWHNYLYQKEFGRSRRKATYSAAYPGATNESGKS